MFLRGFLVRISFVFCPRNRLIEAHADLNVTAGSASSLPPVLLIGGRLFIFAKGRSPDSIEFRSATVSLAADDAWVHGRAGNSVAVNDLSWISNRIPSLSTVTSSSASACFVASTGPPLPVAAVADEARNTAVAAHRASTGMTLIYLNSFHSVVSANSLFNSSSAGVAPVTSAHLAFQLSPTMQIIEGVRYHTDEPVLFLRKSLPSGQISINEITADSIGCFTPKNVAAYAVSESGDVVLLASPQVGTGLFRLRLIYAAGSPSMTAPLTHANQDLVLTADDLANLASAGLNLPAVFGGSTAFFLARSNASSPLNAYVVDDTATAAQRYLSVSVNTTSQWTWGTSVAATGARWLFFTADAPQSAVQLCFFVFNFDIPNFNITTFAIQPNSTSTPEASMFRCTISHSLLPG